MPTSEPPALRLFIAIEFPAAVKAAIAGQIAHWKAADRQRGVRWTQPESLHLTLKFLGDTPADRLPAIKAALVQAAGGIAPFALTIGGSGVFPNVRAPRILWLGVGGELDTLLQLQAGIERFVAPLGFPTEARPFSAHITSGRVRPDARRDALKPILEALAQTGSDLASWQVNAVSLMQSDLKPSGAVYTQLQRVSLTP
ncbi:MAG: RNA 2',3'-cyclic phosphodiesterase [Anaerolineae bacterium]|nr:RNA 2',3'-cyclic phosphodiesterase [Anaerolineae bacterium]